MLEVAGRQSGDPPLRLFVDENVLFVGTMNEDESTPGPEDHDVVNNSGPPFNPLVGGNQLAAAQAARII